MTYRAKPLAADALVTFRPDYRPTATDLPTTMRVFISDARVTTVLVEGKPRQIATVALQYA